VTTLLIIKPTRCTDFLNLCLEWNPTCFRQFLCPSSGVFHSTHSNGIRHTGLLTACEQAVSKPVWRIPLLCVQWKTPDDGQRNCLKHAGFHSKHKFEKLVHLVGLIIRNLSWCMVTLTSNMRQHLSKHGSSLHVVHISQKTVIFMKLPDYCIWLSYTK
jgi:hypothetical protein